jgi:hypothetical protein
MLSNQKKLMNHSKNKNQPNGLDFMKALDILMPYREQLMKIHVAYQNEQCIKKIPYNILDFKDENTIYTDTEANALDNIKLLGKELSKKIHQLETLNIKDLSYDEIVLKHGASPYRFDWHWELKEIYIYLIHLCKDNNVKMMMNSILNGEFVHMIECFLIRI